MKRFRIYFVPAIVLAMATAVHAQESKYNQDSYPAQAFDRAQEAGCPAVSWYYQALQDSAAALQRLRVMCATGQSGSCCEAQATVGAVKACEAGQAPKACCTVKDCACCESCKAKKNVTTAANDWNPYARVRIVPQVIQATPAGATYTRPVAIATQPCPVIPAAYQAQSGGCTVPAVPVQPGQIIQVAMTRSANPVHLVTPDLDARCDRMHHRGDVIVLEGNVLLLVRKNIQPIRIEAQRVIVNMADGSFTVESESRTVVSGFGVMRTGVALPSSQMQIRVPTGTNPPRIVPVQAIPTSERLPAPKSYVPDLRDNSSPR